MTYPATLLSSALLYFSPFNQMCPSCVVFTSSLHARQLSSVVFPLPEGPISAVSPYDSLPSTWLSSVLVCPFLSTPLLMLRSCQTSSVTGCRPRLNDCG